MHVNNASSPVQYLSTEISMHIKEYCTLKEAKSVQNPGLSQIQGEEIDLDFSASLKWI